MRRRLVFGVVICLLVLNATVGANIYLHAARTVDARDVAGPNIQLYADVLDKVRQEYVDGKFLTYHDLVYSSLKGMIGTLDPHSEFMDADNYQELQDDTEGQFGGLGLMVEIKDNFVTVISPMDDSPGEQAGIQAGDRIVKVFGKTVAKRDLTDVVKELRGQPGTPVTLTIVRPSTGVEKDYTLKRAIIQMEMVKDINGKKQFPLGQDKIGYVCITQFGEKTGDELETALGKLKAQGMKGLIIDLRWNPGGLLDQAVEVCQKFLPRGQLVVSTEGRTSVDKYLAQGRGDEIPGLNIVVMVNQDSASAAEIVTGCLQDLHRSIVLGVRTFGKGSVQTIFPLDDGSALKLTVAKYYTPSHKVIHEHGITPDVYVPISDAQEVDLLRHRAPGGLEHLDEASRERVRNAVDMQLDRAQHLLEDLLIYDNRASEAKVAAK
jgi:carboxyl-terminal processing protease